MASVVVSAGSVARLDAGWAPYPSPVGGGLRLFGDHFADYGAIYRTQPSIRKCVGFLGRNLAHLGIHVFRRLSDIDRRRLTDHPLAATLASPNPAAKITRYRLIDSLINDLGIYDNGFWIIVPTGDDDGRVVLLRRHPERIAPLGDPAAPEQYRLFGSRGHLDVPAGQVVHFRGYNPDPGPGGALGLSPLETLRRSIAEDEAMGEYRENLWRNGARMEHVITRPKDAPRWQGDAKDRFWARWNAQFTGGSGSGKTALLEEGMDIKPMSFSAKDAQYAEARVVNDEEAAALYHIPLPMIGRLEHATFSNIKEQHAQLYQDTLGPWMEQLAQDIELQLLPAFADVDRVYVEFNIAEKMRGSFEEQAAAASTATGGPWMTVNEQRARFNLPQLPGADGLITPMNVTVGGQASPRDSAPGSASRQRRRVLRGRRKALEGPLAELLPWVDQHAVLLAAYFADQQAAAAGGDLLDPADWDETLADLLLPVQQELVTEVGGAAAADLGGEFDLADVEELVDAHTAALATNVNTTTADALAVVRGLAAEEIQDALDRLWEVRTTSGVQGAAEGATFSSAAMADHEGARLGGARSKTWQSHGSNQRARHRGMSGTTIAIGGEFPIGRGARWPRDHKIGDVGQIAGCTCTLTYSTEEP